MCAKQSVAHYWPIVKFALGQSFYFDLALGSAGFTCGRCVKGPAKPAAVLGKERKRVRSQAYCLLFSAD
ncbi:hypothetical protein RRG08_003225 [Elysia crispata]|uniref:Uncharacterized protein n=1 Tax=Elysia crispata TaxID=231223 RepID=A0AAE1AYM4_9GAST|nr:hypothetical protein RRG08_003225 [Elysia crispata]